MSDRADEIAAKVYDTLDAGHMISEGDLADLIRAYGDERVRELEEALDQYREDADEWKCPTCGEWQRPWQMYCDKDECRAALKEKP